jgi:hypothetical protein
VDIHHILTAISLAVGIFLGSQAVYQVERYRLRHRRLAEQASRKETAIIFRLERQIDQLQQHPTESSPVTLAQLNEALNEALARERERAHQQALIEGRQQLGINIALTVGSLIAGWLLSNFVHL